MNIMKLTKRLQKQAQNHHRNVSEEEKGKKEEIDT